MKSLLIILMSLYSGIIFAAPDVKSFTEGKRVKYTTLNHPKAKGLNIVLYYPNGWVAEEGQLPHIVQKFSSRDGGDVSETVTMLVKELPIPKDVKPTEEDLIAFFSDEALQGMVPKGAKILSKKRTKIEGMTAGMVEFQAANERLGVKLKMQSLVVAFVYNNNLISITFNIAILDESKKSLNKLMEEYRPLYMAMANSISIPDKWK